MVKIASIKVSRIEIRKGQRTASFSNPDENAKVIEILKNGNDIDVCSKRQLRVWYRHVNEDN